MQVINNAANRNNEEERIQYPWGEDIRRFPRRQSKFRMKVAGGSCRGLKFDFHVRLADTIFSRWPGGHGDGSWKSRGRDRSIRARLLGPCLAGSPLPHPSFYLSRSVVVRELSPSFSLSVVRARDPFSSRYNSKGIPSRARWRPFPREKAHTHARMYTRAMQKRSSSSCYRKGICSSGTQQRGKG